MTRSSPQPNADSMSTEVLQTAPAVESFSFRTAMGRLATGVSLVTVEDDELDVHGMTINSFTSISLAPPTVIISLKDGKMHRLVTRRGWFGISVLCEDSRDHSAHFSGRPLKGMEPDFRIRDRVPTLRNALAWFECEVTDRIAIHDHTLFVAVVTACGSADGKPLLFFSSAYRQLAPEAKG